MHFGSLAMLDLNEVIVLLAIVEPGRPPRSALMRIDAAAAEMVHENSGAHSGLMYKTLKPATLFPVV